MAVLQQNTAANVSLPCDPNVTATCQNFFFIKHRRTKQRSALGLHVGAGLDWALTPNIFARGEFEFVQFAPITNIAVSVASGRVGAGFKF